MVLISTDKGCTEILHAGVIDYLSLSFERVISSNALSRVARNACCTRHNHT